MDKIAALNPDVILTFDGHHYSEYSKIAPTLSIAWSLSFFERFQRLAEWVGRDKRANEWVDNYLQQISVTRDLILRQIGDQTVSFFWSRGLPETFQVYYDHPILYRDLKLNPPQAVTMVQQIQGHPFKLNVPVQELAQYGGDHLFMVVSSDQDSVHFMRELAQSELWRGIPAVRNNRVYFVSEDWIREDPISLDGQMKDIMRIMNLSWGNSV